MSLSINSPDYSNIGLTETEAEMMKGFDAMSADEQATIFHQSRQYSADQKFINSIEQHEAANSNIVQHRANGEVQVGGQLHPDTLINVDGMEMTVQQAVDAGVYTTALLDAHSYDAVHDHEQKNDGKMLDGVPMSQVVVNKSGQLVHEEDGQLYVYVEADGCWYEAE